MIKSKAVIVTIAMLFSIFTAACITTGMQEESMSKMSVNFIVKLEPEITIDTNKLHYEVGETVKVIYTNVGDAVAGFVVGTARPVIPCIIECKTGMELLLTDPSQCYPCVMMYGVLEPGDSLTLEWDQQYYGYYGDSFTPSEQVPEGRYYIELGYWEVTGKYIPPYMVPGGPPDHFERSKIFNIGKGWSESDILPVSIPKT